MGAQFRCGHCQRGLSFDLWCPLTDACTADCCHSRIPKFAKVSSMTLRDVAELEDTESQAWATRLSRSQFTGTK